MPFRFRIWRGDRDFEMMQLEQMRDVIERSRELLASSPVPTTFAGRKTQDPFPQEEEAHMAQWMASKESKPPE